MTTPEARLRPGTRVGPYEVVRLLGRGGMGVVHEAVDPSLGRRVALKVIAPGLAAQPEFRERFTREAQAQASLDSPHVVQVFAHGEADGVLYLATQLVPDGDLRALLRGGPVATGTALHVVAQVAAGLADAHAAGLVHGDVKPGNVLLRRRGAGLSAYLADFGLARRPGRDHPGADDLAAGTPAFMAPELHAGAAPGPASDVYALGCVLRTALSDRAVRTRRLRAVLRAALAEDPAARPTAADLRDDLRALAAARRLPPRVYAGAAAAVAVTTAVALVPAGPAPREGRQEQETATASLAAALVEEAGYTAEQAACAAAGLVRTAGVDVLREEGVLDDRLEVRADPAGGTDPALLAAVLDAGVPCLFGR